MKGKNPLNGRICGKNNGSVLISVIIVVSFISILGMSLIALLFSRMTYSALQLERLKANYLAEAGISRSIWELKFDLDADGDGVGNVSRTRLGDGYFWARHDFQNSLITATGEVNGFKRTFQIKYSSI